MRREDWEQALSDYLAEHGGAVFAWGSCDCAMFAAGAVEAMTGTDPAADVRGRYRTLAGSGRTIRQKGFSDLGGWVSSLFEEIPPAFAHRGDIVMADGNLGIAAGSVAWFVGEEGGVPGLVSRPLQEWDRAWRVPYSG